MVLRINRLLIESLYIALAVFAALNSADIAAIIGPNIPHGLIIGFSALVVTPFLARVLNSYKLSWSHLAFLLLYVVVCIHFAFLPHDAKSLNKGIEAVAIFPVLFILAMTIKANNEVKILEMIFVVVMIYMIVTFVAFLVQIQSGVMEVANRGGAITDSYHRVGRLAVIAVVGAYYFIDKKQNVLWCYVAIFSAFLSVILAANRIGFLVVVALFLYFEVVRRLNWNQHRKIKPGFKLAAISLSVLFTFIYFIQQYGEFVEKIYYLFSRLESLSEGKGNSFNRFVMWERSIGEYFTSENWLFGLGFGKFSEATSLTTWRHPHNIFVELITELGVFSLLFFKILLISIYKSNIYIKAIILALLAQAMVGGDITDNRHLIMFLLIA